VLAYAHHLLLPCAPESFEAAIVAFEDALLALGCDLASVVAEESQLDKLQDVPPRPSKRRGRRGSVTAMPSVVVQAEIDCRTGLANSLYRLGLLEPLGTQSCRTQLLFQRANQQYNLAMALRPQGPVQAAQRALSTALDQHSLSSLAPMAHHVDLPSKEGKDECNATQPMVVGLPPNHPPSATNAGNPLGIVAPQAPAADPDDPAAAARARVRLMDDNREAQWEGALATLQKARDATPGHSVVLAELASAFTLLARHCR